MLASAFTVLAFFVTSVMGGIVGGAALWYGFSRMQAQGKHTGCRRGE